MFSQFQVDPKRLENYEHLIEILEEQLYQVRSHETFLYKKSTATFPKTRIGNQLILIYYYRKICLTRQQNSAKV